MKIRNYELNDLQEFLMKFKLKGKETRLRTRFVRKLNEYLNRMNDEHMDLIKAYANLDEEGNPIIVDIDGVRKYDMTKENLRSFNIEYSKLLSEKVIIVPNEENKEMLSFIKELILGCEMTFSGEEALKYDRYCDIVEEMILD